MESMESLLDLSNRIAEKRRHNDLFIPSPQVSDRDSPDARVAWSLQ
jgi:hypothetical protein